MRLARLIIVLLTAAFVLFATGCARRGDLKKTATPEEDTSAMAMDLPEEDPLPPPEEPAPEPEPEPEPMKYVVQKGDTLWDISTMGKIYKDPFQWPLIFRANRDEIDDPDLIEIGQEFVLKKVFSADEIQAARQKAMDSPRYRPHTAPRKKLPLKY